jgi:hypothetical protein
MMTKDQKPLWRIGKKRDTFSREQGAKSREQRAKSREQRAGENIKFISEIIVK